MSVPLRQDSDDLLEILRAYRFPTIIIFVGLVLAILGFQATLKYDMKQSENAFQEIAEQVFSDLESETYRHMQILSSMSRILGQIKDLTEEEFADTASIFEDATYFSHFYFYEYDVQSDDTDTPEGIQSVFSSSPEENMHALKLAALPEIESTIKEARIQGKVYISNPFQASTSASENFIVLITPLAGKYLKDLYLVGILNLNSVFANTLQTENQSVNIRVQHITGDQKSVIYEYIEPEALQFFTALEKINTKEGSLIFNRSLFFENHQWKVTISSSFKNQIEYIGLLPWITFIAILLIVCLLSYIVFRITTENLKAQILVEKQTQSLREYAARLEMTNRDLDDFAYIASHDLKEPLRGMYNYAEFLYEDYQDKLDEDGKNKLETLKKLSRRMDSLISSLLEHSRLSRIELAFQKNDLNEIVEDVRETLEIWLEDRNAEVILIDTLPEVLCDAVRVSEIFRNLITNAVKYNDKDKKTVEIGFHRNESEWLDIPVFYVKDNGIGIAEEHKKQVFKIFRRLHARDSYEGGTGAGLTIVWKIIERHGGKIWIESEQGKGTTFFFTLKRKKHD